jgi:hypothetical protein
MLVAGAILMLRARRVTVAPPIGAKPA